MPYAIKQEVSVTAAIGTTDEIPYSEFDSGMVHVPNGEAVVTLTWWATYELGGTYEAALKPVDLALTPITYLATSQTVAADGSYPIPDSLKGAVGLKIVGNVTANLKLSLKSSS